MSIELPPLCESCPLNGMDFDTSTRTPARNVCLGSGVPESGIEVATGRYKIERRCPQWLLKGEVVVEIQGNRIIIGHAEEIENQG